MPRSQLLEQAKQMLGYRPPARCLEWALRTGAVSQPKRFGPHYFYDESHLEAFVRYMETKSTVGRRMAEALAQ
jgi:hypothetical protein